MDNNIFKQDAKSIVDMLFEGRVFRDDLTRDDMNQLEEYVQFLLSSRFDSYKRIEVIMQKMKSKSKEEQA